MLHHLAGDADAALAAMRLLLKDDPDGQKPQAARNVVVLYAIKKDLIPEANGSSRSVHASSTAKRRRSLSHGASDHRRVPACERLRVDGNACEANVRRVEEVYRERIKAKSSRRDEMLLKSTVLLADSYLKTNQKDGAIAALTDLRRLSIQLPSATLYRDATIRLARLNPELNVEDLFDDSLVSKAALPELVGGRVDRAAAEEVD